MDVVTLGAALNGSAEYVNSHFKGGSNIQIVDNPDGTQTINASGEVSSEDTVARAEIAEIKDGETLDSFGDVETALTGKVDKVTGKGLSTNDYTAAEKTKLAGIEAQANKTTVDDALSGSSTNPVQNKVIKSALDSKADTSDIPTVPITAIQKNGTGITPVSGTVNITVPTQASDINAATAIQGVKADTAIQGIKVNSSTVNPDSNKVVNITVPTTAADVSALPDTTKYAAALSLTINSSTFVMTGQLKDQNGDNLGTAQTIDLPLESVVVGGRYDSQTKKVILTLQNGDTIDFSVADLVSGLQTELSASNKLNPAYINYDSTHRAVSDTEKSTWNGKQNALSFDGTYSASTNKAATVSTVTNAVNALDVTGDASVSASKTISAWSETDGKVSISTQDIAIAGTQTTLTGYAKSGTAGQAVAATDNVNQAIGKLEATVDDNKNNISFAVEKIGNNLVNVPSGSGLRWVDVTVNIHPGVYTFGFSNLSGDDIRQSQVSFYSADSSFYTYIDKGNDVYINNVTFTNTVTKIRIYASTNSTTSTNQGVNFTTLFLCKQETWNSSVGIQPYAMSNAELTAAIQAIQTQLANQ